MIDLPVMGKPSVTVSVRLDVNDYLVLEKCARNKGSNMSVIIRGLVKNYLKYECVEEVEEVKKSED